MTSASDVAVPRLRSIGRRRGVFWEGELLEAFVLDDQFEPGYISPAGHSVPPRLEPSMIQCATASVVAFARAVGFTSEPLSPCPGHPDVLALEVLVSEGQAAHVRVDQWTILGRTLVRSTDSSAAAAFAEQIASGVASRVTLT